MSRSITSIFHRGPGLSRHSSSFEGTVLAVVHDRYFIDRFASSVWKIKDGKVQIW